MTASGTTTASVVPAPGHGVERLFLTAEEVAGILHIGRTRVYALMAARELTSVKIGSLRRVPVDAVRSYAAGLVSLELGAS
jgi:excisionase family DNA binding protein